MTRKKPSAARNRGTTKDRASPRKTPGRVAPTPIENCVQAELQRYFELLDGQPPADLYRMVMCQAESALLSKVMKECGGNQSKAATWLGISRGNLRKKLADMEYLST